MTEKEKELMKELFYEINWVIRGKKPAVKKQEKILKKLGFTEEEIELLILERGRND